MSDRLWRSIDYGQGCLVLAGITLITAGGLNSVLAIVVGTCTGGDAGNLGGGIITLFLYTVGFAGLIASRPRPGYLFALLPAALIAAWHSWFALRLTYGYLVQDASACFVIHGGFEPRHAGEWMDGGEMFYIFTWLGLSAIFWGGLVKLLLLARTEWRASRSQAD